MDEQTKRKYALLAIGATGACVAAIILLVRSAIKSGGEPDTATAVVAVFLMSAAAVVAFWVKKKRKDAIELEKNPPPEPVDEEWEALLDYFYDMEREDEFYSCLEAYGEIEYVDDYEDSVAAFEQVKAQALAQGSKEYIWRTSRDQDVCNRCRRQNGKRYNWNTPPRGGHPGCAPGCRCEAEPVIAVDRSRSNAGGRTKRN